MVGNMYDLFEKYVVVCRLSDSEYEFMFYQM